MSEVNTQKDRVDEVQEELEELKEEFSNFKTENVHWKHKTELKIAGITKDVSELQKSTYEILENSRWMKRAITKGFISLGVSLLGSLIIGMTAIVWALVTK